MASSDTHAIEKDSNAVLWEIPEVIELGRVADSLAGLAPMSGSGGGGG